ncbi:MAG: hypothetical protein ACK5NB_05945 [Flavobacteriaceae bacterium]
MHFKDNKVKIDSPIIKLTTYTGQNQTLHIYYPKFSINGSDLGIYGKKNKLKSEKAKYDLENYFNDYIDKLKKSINKYEANKDW